jgi:hypothetical protein
MGVAVFSGMLGVTFFGLLLTPVFYVVIQRLVLGRDAVADSDTRGLRPPDGSILPVPAGESAHA